MLTKPTAAALTALAQLEETPRWRDISTMLEDAIAALTKRLLGARETADVHELRGRISSLRAVRQTVLDARVMLANVGRTVPLA
jgi:hypothetical protein